jgi:hypothetical protein
MGILGQPWLNLTGVPSGFATHLWTGSFGSTPTFQGLIDANLQQAGRGVGGGADGDIDMGSTGTMHITTLIGLLTRTATGQGFQLGVSAITCPNPAAAGFNIGQCTDQIIATSVCDRPWITSDGPTVYISYHDPARAGHIDVQRSDDDGYTWKRVGDPVAGQDASPDNAKDLNEIGNLAVDPLTHEVYAIYAGGAGSLRSGGPSDYPGPNEIVVARSDDWGETWTNTLVYQAPAGSDLASPFPSLAVDPTNGNLYATWSDGSHVSMSLSSDHGAGWSSPIVVNTAPASTAVMPWVAAYRGSVDLAYYGTDTTNNPSAVWNVYLAQTTDGVDFTQSVVSNHPNHVGVICTHGDGCPAGTRNLLDFFLIAIDHHTGKAAVAYADDALTTAPSSIDSYACSPGETTCPVPQVLLAQEL